MLPALAQAMEDPRPMTDAEQRLACWEMYNTFWQDASDRGAASQPALEAVAGERTA